MDEEARKESYWRNRGGEGPNPWTGHPNDFNDPTPMPKPGSVIKGDSVDELMKYASKLAEDTVSALDTQVGGGHYKDFPIQPIEYIQENGLGFIEGSIVKYITRYEEKGGANDLDKIIHYCELLKELKYGK